MLGRRGFTLVEMLTVMIFIGVLAGIALLKYIDLRNTARTSSLAGDVRAVTVAVFSYYGDKDLWPAEVGAGTVPVGLEPYLPGELSQSFDRGFYALDYENIFTTPTQPIIGVSVTSTDVRLMAKFIDSFASKYPFFMNGGKLTFLIVGL